MKYCCKCVTESDTFTAIFKKFELCVAGSALRLLKRQLTEFGIDYAHIPQGRDANRGRKFRSPTNKLSSTIVLQENSDHSRATARRCILRECLLEYKCKLCDQGSVWNGSKLTLNLDHINGIRNDHRLVNLRFLCPNCDSQSSTYGGRNITYYHYCDCGNKVVKRQRKCSSCKLHNKKLRPTRSPSKEELSVLIWQLSALEIGKRFGVSDVAVAKWCKKFGLEKPGPGYWSKSRASVV